MEEQLNVEAVATRILVVRGIRVILDSDLASLYRVETKNLNLQVKRNKRRFPDDFMFQLTKEEGLRLHFATSKRGGRRYPPYVFTEQGVAMLSSVLNSERAVEVNIAIMRAFVKLREILLTHKDIAEKIAQLEKKSAEHDANFVAVFEAIRQLMEPPPVPEKPRIGFHP